MLILFHKKCLDSYRTPQSSTASLWAGPGKCLNTHLKLSHYFSVLFTLLSLTSSMFSLCIRIMWVKPTTIVCIMSSFFKKWNAHIFSSCCRNVSVLDDNFWKNNPLNATSNYSEATKTIHSSVLLPTFLLTLFTLPINLGKCKDFAKWIHSECRSLSEWDRLPWRTTPGITLARFR